MNWIEKLCLARQSLKRLRKVYWKALPEFHNKENKRKWHHAIAIHLRRWRSGIPAQVFPNYPRDMVFYPFLRFSFLLPTHFWGDPTQKNEIKHPCCDILGSNVSVHFMPKKMLSIWHQPIHSVSGGEEPHSAMGKRRWDIFYSFKIFYLSFFFSSNEFSGFPETTEGFSLFLFFLSLSSADRPLLSERRPHQKWMHQKEHWLYFHRIRKVLFDALLSLQWEIESSGDFFIIAI